MDLCRKVEAAGVSFLSVHGRTIKQKSTEAEPVDLEAIKTIRQSVQLPVVANGDVFSLEGLNTQQRFPINQTCVLVSEVLLR